MSHLNGMKITKDFLKNFFTRNLLVKIICLVLATFFWLYASANQTKTAIFPVAIPIGTKNVPDNLETSYNEREVTIKIVADYAVWGRLSADSFEAYVDLSNLKEGTHELAVVVRSKVVGVQIVDQNPDKIFVSLASGAGIKTKTVGVFVQATGQPAEGYWVEKITVSPAVLTLNGNSQVLAPIDRISTKEIKINGLNSSITRTVALDLPTGVETIDGITTVIVMIKISSLTNVSQTTASINPQNLDSTLEIVSISPSTISVALAGDNTILSKIDTYTINCNLDLTGQGEGIFEIKLDKADFVVPQGISVVNFLPTSVKVELKKR